MVTTTTRRNFLGIFAGGTAMTVAGFDPVAEGMPRLSVSFAQACERFFLGDMAPAMFEGAANTVARDVWAKKAPDVPVLPEREFRTLLLNGLLKQDVGRFVTPRYTFDMFEGMLPDVSHPAPAA